VPHRGRFLLDGCYRGWRSLDAHRKEYPGKAYNGPKQDRHKGDSKGLLPTPSPRGWEIGSLHEFHGRHTPDRAKAGRPQAGLEFVEKLLTMKLKSIDMTGRNGSMLRLAPRPVIVVELATGFGSASPWSSLPSPIGGSGPAPRPASRPWIGRCRPQRSNSAAGGGTRRPGRAAGATTVVPLGALRGRVPPWSGRPGMP